MKDVYKKKIRLTTLIIAMVFFNAFMLSNSSAHSMLKVIIVAPEVSFVINIFIAIASIYLVKEITGLIAKEQKLKVLEQQAEQNEKLSTIIKSIKHDINNQITVIDGMYQLGKRKEALEYTKNITSDLDWIAKVLNIDHPEIASLIISKVNEASKFGIVTYLEVECSGKLDLRAPISNVTRIMGNLLDNAIYALQRQDCFQKEIYIRIYEIQRSFKIEIENSGEIEKEIQTKIFDKGFTTKGKEGNGFGLYIVKTLVESMGGRVNLQSQDNSTRFTVEF